MKIFDLEKVKIIFTDRWEGFSKTPFNSLNLGFHVGDDFLSVKQKQKIFVRKI